jgi:hypothetical protein
VLSHILLDPSNTTVVRPSVHSGVDRSHVPSAVRGQYGELAMAGPKIDHPPRSKQFEQLLERRAK